MKKALAFALILALAATGLTAAAKENAVTVRVGGAAVIFPDAQPFVDENGRVQAPVRAIAEALGQTVKWNEAAQAVFIGGDNGGGDGTGKGGGGEGGITIVIGSNEIKRGSETIKMDTAAVIKEGRTFVPARFVAECFGYEVKWDGGANRADLIRKPQGGFDLAMLQDMPKDKNYMFSPFSLKMALAMAANGAEGETRSEILDVLGIADLELFNSAAKKFIEDSNRNSAVKFNIANSIWHNSDFYGDAALDFSDGYKSVIKNNYLGAAEKIDNATGAKTVNDWISAATMKKITNVINDDVVKKSLSFLVNTIYFKGDWAVPFKAEATGDNIFTERGGAKKTAKFMNQTGYYDYFENAGFQMLAKPYKDNNIKMYFILPKNDKPISGADFKSAADSMGTENVRLSLPKFKTEYLHSDLRIMLRGMGIQTAFDADKADFNKMYSKKPADNVFIGLILQKTFIEVDEKGTEAAAATVIAMAAGAMPPEKTIEFICDKPFIYIIRDDATGEILFFGEYAYVE